MPYSTPSNMTSIVDVLNYTDNITKLHDLSGNDLTGGSFIFLMLFFLYVMTFMTLLTRSRPTTAFAVTSWIYTIIAIGFGAMGLLDGTIIGVMVILSFVGFISLYIDK
jgi:hypothetical protein